MDRIWIPGHQCAKARIMLNDFRPTSFSQLNLFGDTQPRAGSDKLMKVLDSTNHSVHEKNVFQERRTMLCSR
ncbi:hypothetical protein [uncultured Cedecea sp.]|uniref:hypothetical protein n=1 Tax=uncultured Cedecea sp. TaxID=988762 RepID=UPI00345D8EEC